MQYETYYLPFNDIKQDTCENALVKLACHVTDQSAIYKPVFTLHSESLLK